MQIMRTRQRRHTSGNSNTPRLECLASTSSRTATPLPFQPPREAKRRGSTPRRILLNIETSDQNEASRSTRSKGFSEQVAGTGRRASSAPPIDLKPVIPSILSQRKMSTFSTFSRRNSTNTKEKDCPTRMELLSSLLQEYYVGKRSLRRAFLSWDRDKDGKLEPVEIRQIIDSLNFTEALGGEPAVDNLIDEISSTPTGGWEYDAFVRCARGDDEGDENVTLPLDQEKQSDFERRTRPLHERVFSREEVEHLLKEKYASRKLRSVFRSWDENKDGGVTVQEMDEKLRSQGLLLSSEDVKKLLDTYDTDNDGVLQYSELNSMLCENTLANPQTKKAEGQRKLLKQYQIRKKEKLGDALSMLRNPIAVDPKRVLNDEKLRSSVHSKLRSWGARLNDIYATFDTDRSGSLSYQEFRTGLQTLGLNLTSPEFHHLMSVVDTDGNRAISFNEFVQLYTDSRARQGTPPVQPQVPPIHLIPRGFDFSQLQRKMEVPTRRGNVPRKSTKDLISNSNDANFCWFATESQHYGGFASSRGHEKTEEVRPVHPTLAEEERKTKAIQRQARSDRIQKAEQRYFSSIFGGSSPNQQSTSFM